MKNTIIAHLSDLHINHKYFPERSALLHETLRQCRERGVEHLVITGDLSHLGRADELEHCAAILREHGYWDSSRLTVTIGNHDIYGGPYLAEDVITFPGNCRDTDYQAKVETFRTIFAPAFESTIDAERGSIFPFMKFVGSIALIGINTVARWSALHNPLGSNGDIDAEQYERLDLLLGDRRLHGKRIIALTHHHFHTPKYLASGSLMESLWQRIEGQTLKLRNRKRLLALLKAKGIGMLMHGHVHEHSEYQSGGVTCYNAGASMLPGAGQERNFHILGVADDTPTLRHRNPARHAQTRAGAPQIIFST